MNQSPDHANDAAADRPVVENQFDNSSLLLILRFALLRTLLLTAIVVECYAITLGAFWFPKQGSFVGLFYTHARDVFACLILSLLCPLVIFSHHFASAFGPRLSLPAIVDFLLIIAESTVALWNTNAVEVNALDPLIAIPTIYFLSAAWINNISLLLLAAFRITDMIKKGPKHLLTRVDFPGYKRGSNRFTPKEVLLGMSNVWKRRIYNEEQWLVILRGFVTISSILLIVAFAFTTIIVGPVRELSLTSIREYRSTALPTDISNVPVDFPKVVFQANDLISQGDLVSAITVTFLGQITDEWPCSYVPDLVDTNFVTFICQTTISDFLSLVDIFPPFGFNIVVNFSELQTKYPEVMGNSPIDVRIGFANDTLDALVFRTPPTLLYPGANLIGRAHIVIRQQFKSSGPFALGVFTKWKTYLVTEMIHVYNNPNISLSSNNTASLRAYVYNGFSEYRVIQDFNGQSVLNGFSATGGLSTFLSSIIAWLFGHSIIRILFGSKPLSIFGLLHSFGRDRIRKAYLERYPCLPSDLRVEPVNKGLLSLIHDHLVDVNLLDSTYPTEDAENSAEPEPA